MGLESLPERIIRTTIVVALVAGYPPALVLGIPAFLILKSLARASIPNCALTGALVALTPWLLLVLFSNPDEAFSGNPDEAFSGGHVTVHDGAKT